MAHTPFEFNLALTPTELSHLQASLGVQPGQTSGSLENSDVALTWQLAAGDPPASVAVTVTKCKSLAAKVASAGIIQQHVAEQLTQHAG